MQKIDFSLILPSYNEGPTFKKNVERILKELSSLKKNCEVIFVEDKSRDDTRLKVEELVLAIPNARAIYHKKNQGRGKSVVDGILMAKGNICGFMDVDCEISPSYVPIFIEEIKKGNDMTIANRYYEGKSNSILRLLASRIYFKLASVLLTLPFKDTEAGFKFFNRERIIPILKSTKEKGWFWDTEICVKAYLNGLKISEVPVLFKRRSDKKSTVKIVPDGTQYLLKLISFRAAMNKRLTHND
jgi:dolichol-phosphate mannosyltransferase